MSQSSMDFLAELSSGMQMHDQGRPIELQRLRDLRPTWCKMWLYREKRFGLRKCWIGVSSSGKRPFCGLVVRVSRLQAMQNFYVNESMDELRKRGL